MKAIDKREILWHKPQHDSDYIQRLIQTSRDFASRRVLFSGRLVSYTESPNMSFPQHQFTNITQVGLSVVAGVDLVRCPAVASGTSLPAIGSAQIT